MLAVHGYYDGNTIKTFEKVSAKPNQRVIITFMEEFVEPTHENAPKSVRGILSSYADPDLAAKEKGAWERAVEEKHGFS